MTARRPFLAASVVALAIGCARAPDDAVTRCEASRVVPAAVKTDILFVIDDSASMSQEQSNLAKELKGFIEALASAPVANEFQIGVTNTSVEGAPNSSGVMQKSYGTSSPSAGVPYPAGAIIAIERDGSGPLAGKLVWSQADGFGAAPLTRRILTAASPTLVDDFTANVMVGTNGSSKEQAFRAAQLAVTDRVADGTNAGFLRAGARLAIVFLSDEDDCSDAAAPFASDLQCSDPAWKTGDLDSVDGFASFLRAPIAGESRDVVVAAIAGVNATTFAPSCGTLGGITCADTTCGTAWDGGDRFVKLTKDLGSVHTRVASICDGGSDTSPGFGHALEEIAGLLVSQSMPLDGVPADWHMLVAGIERAGQTIPCPIELEGSPAAPTAAAVYSPPQEGRSASVTFQGVCQLQQGDVVKLDVICAG